MNFKGFLLMYLTLLCNAVLLCGQQHTIQFKHLTVEDGLSQSWVQSICQDRFGFIWIGTEDGLNRYDGYNFEVYKHNTKNQYTINGNWVLFIMEDSKGNLWICNNHGLNLYDRQHNRFVSKPHWPKKTVTSVAEDENHNLYIRTERNLFYLNLETDTTIEIQSFNSFQDRSYRYSKLFIDSNKDLWIGSNSAGLYWYNKKNDSFINYRHEENNPNSLSNNDVRSIFQDKSGRLWIGTVAGLDLLINVKDHSSKGKFLRFQNNTHDPKSISQGTVLSLLEDRKNNLWIGIENGGLDRLNLDDYKNGARNFIHYRSSPYIEASLSNNSIYSLFQDKQDNIWIGNYGKGVDIISPVGIKFEHFVNEPDNKHSLSNNHVNVFCEDQDNIWIGTEGGLDRYNLKTGTFKHFVHNPSDLTSIGADAIWSIYKDKRGNLWVGTWAGGLNLFNYKTETFIRYLNNPKDSSSLSSNNVFSVFEDSKGNLWVGTMKGGLNLFDRDKKTFKHYMQYNSKISSDYVPTIIETRDGDLWFENINSLERYNVKKQIFTPYVHDPKDVTSISSHKVYPLFEDSKGCLWAGTDVGLNFFNKQTGKFRYYQIEDGLPNNSIKSILEDRHGNLWIGTNNGLSKFINAIEHPVSPKFKNYTSEDGLQGSEFNQRSTLLSSSGMMYFGGINGFNRFYPDSIKENPYIPEVVITDFLLFNKPVEIGTEDSPLKQQACMTKRIELTHNQSVFSFKYVAFNYVLSKKNQYAYMLEGFENDWNYVGNKREATYTNLNPGKYTFRVKASNNDEVWNETGTSIEIIILPPWWENRWFKIALVLFIISLLSFAYFARIAIYKKRQEVLTNIVGERTQELQNSNKNLLEQQVDIENFAKEVNSQNQRLQVANDLLLEHKSRIEVQSEELHSQALKLEETNRELVILNATKDRLFSIIAHDLRNPFHAVSGFSEILLRNYKKLDSEKIEKYLNIINTSSTNGYNLLENLLQWTNAQTGHITYDPKSLVLESTIKEDIVLLEGMAQQKNITLKIELNHGIEVLADINMVKTIFRNLISNSIKFTHQNGSIIVKSCLNGLFVEISIVDTGVGMSEEKQKILFNIDANVSTRGTSEEKGTGLGLILCKEFVEKNGGTISVHSELNKGSEFRFTLRHA